jgi:transposase
VLSQFCRKCKGDFAEYVESMVPLHKEKRAFLVGIWHFFSLTIGTRTGILTSRTLLFEELLMPDEKLKVLRASRTLHPHPEAVRDPLFTSGSPFFDPRDLVQVKYELLRRVRVDGYAVSEATALFALSRPTFYAAQAAWEQAGVSGLLPASTGPRHAHKLTDEIMAELQPLAKTMSPAQLAEWVQEQHHLSVHPRSIERALKRVAKKGGASA